MRGKIKGPEYTTKNTEPTPEYFNNKQQLILMDIGGQWYAEKNINPPPPLKNPRLSSKTNKKSTL